MKKLRIIDEVVSKTLGTACRSKHEPKTVGLVGNPNTGKTTLFNRLTGTRQRVGNYPGVTVEKRDGKMLLGDESITVNDLPGSYSLSASSADERVVVDYLSGRILGMPKPSLVVCVLDAKNLSRNLYLASQIADWGVPMVLALNMADEAKTEGVEIDVQALSERFGVPIVSTVATTGQGLDELREAIAGSFINPKYMPRVIWPEQVQDAFSTFQQQVAFEAEDSISEPELFRVFFERDSAVALRAGVSKEELRGAGSQARKQLRAFGYQPDRLEAQLRYDWLNERLGGVIKESTSKRLAVSDAIDKVLLHRVWGIVVFAIIMCLVFQSIYALASPFMDFIEASFGSLGNVAGAYFKSFPILQSLIVDGVIAGVGSVVVFLPQILVLFLFIAILEDSGYMARAAFLMDRALGWCGLSGKSFVPMLSSFACAVPGIMAARTIEDSKSRLVTILVAPLMSCSARLPVYVLLIGAFIEPLYGPTWAGVALFGMHFLGLLIALPAAYVLNRFVLGGRENALVLEIPPYRLPRLRDVLWRLYDRAKSFVLRAGTVILAMSVIIWALCYFPRSAEVKDRVRASFLEEVRVERELSPKGAEELLEAEVKPELLSRVSGAYLEQSYMGRVGKTFQPVFAPAGFDWKITTSVLASFPAREVVISTLGILYNLGSDVDEESTALVTQLRDAERADGSAVFTPAVAVAIMVFFALCLQCGATVATLAQESSWKWAMLSFSAMTVFAWIGAVVVYQVGTAFF